MNWRRLDYNLARLRSLLISCILNSIVYFQIDDSIQGGLQSVFSALSLSIIGLGVDSVSTIIYALIDTRLQFYRENSMRTYHPIIHIISLIICEAIYSLCFTLILTIIMYPSIGLNPGFDHVMTFILLLFEWLLFCGCLGQCFAYLFPNIGSGSTAAGIIISFAVNFSGYLIPYQNLNIPWKWLFWINPETFVIQAAAINQFKCNHYYTNIDKCPMVKIHTINGEKQVYIHDYIIDTYGIKYNLLWNYILYKIIAIFIIIILTYLCLINIKYITR